jgi:HAD superfamily hydrolase (TIGR01509 family)
LSIQVVLLDAMNTTLYRDFAAEAAAFCAHLKSSYFTLPQVQQLTVEEVRSTLLECDRLVSEEDWDEERYAKEVYGRLTGLSGPRTAAHWYNVLSRCARQSAHVDEDVEATLRELQSRGLKTILYSEAHFRGKRLIYDLLQHAGIQHLFNEIIVTIDLGANKREVRGYKMIAERLGVEPQNILFVDDNPSNLEVPVKMGIKTVVPLTADGAATKLIRQRKTSQRKLRGEGHQVIKRLRDLLELPELANLPMTSTSASR